MQPSETNNKIYKVGIYWLNSLFRSGNLYLPAVLTIDNRKITIRTADRTLIDAPADQLNIAFRKSKLRSMYLTIKSGRDTYNFTNAPGATAPGFSDEQLAELDNQSDIISNRNQSEQNVPLVAAAVGFRLIPRLNTLSPGANLLLASRNYEQAVGNYRLFQKLSDVFTKYGIRHKQPSFRILSLKGLYLNILIAVPVYIILVFLLNVAALLWEDPLFPNTMPVTIGSFLLVPISIFMVFKFSPLK